VKSEKSAVNLVWGTVTCIKLGQDLVITSVSNIFRHLARSSGPIKLYGNTNLEMAEVYSCVSPTKLCQSIKILITSAHFCEPSI